MPLRLLAWAAGWLATLGLVLPGRTALAQQPDSPAHGPLPASAQHAPNTPAPLVSDVRLSSGGELLGTVVDPQGQTMPQVEVTVLQAGQPIARTNSDLQGNFRVVGLRGGVYQLSAAGGTLAVRMWDPVTAPPAARGAVLLVGAAQVVRANAHSGHNMPHISDAFIVTAIVAAAVAIPVTLSISRNPNSGAGAAGSNDVPSGS